MTDLEPWIVERNFWVKRANRAFIRYEDAIKRGDVVASEIAEKQHSLYYRRFKAVPVPEEVINKWNQENEAERLAALNEQ